MPLYSYKCSKCRYEWDARLRFGAVPPGCPRCGGKARKVFSPPAIHFIGDGFHCNDYTATGPKETSA